MAAGADLVVQSAHKTLPSLTQTAFLQLNGDLADPAEVERQLDVFETSSPSYPLMASLDGCTRWLAEEGSAAFAAWRARLDRFDAAVKDLQKTKVMCFGRDALDAHPCFFAHDSGKILLQIGTEGAAYLRADGFEPEMVCGPNVLAMTSPCDEENALDRLAAVLHAWEEQAVPPAPAAHILPPPGAARCTIAEALLRRVTNSNTIICLGALVIAVIVYAIFVLTLQCITYEDCLLLPKGEKIAKILHIKHKT